MEVYVMECPKTGDRVSCYWYEAMELKGKGWVEVGYTPAPYSY